MSMILDGTTGITQPTGAAPAFSAYRATSTQTITNATNTKIQLNAKTFDTANCFDATTNYRFTPNVAGYYYINGVIGASAGSLFPVIYKNGSTAKYGPVTSYVAGVGGTTEIAALMYLNGTDYVELYIYLTSSTALYTGASQTYFQGFLARAA